MFCSHSMESGYPGLGSEKSIIRTTLLPKFAFKILSNLGIPHVPEDVVTLWWTEILTFYTCYIEQILYSEYVG